MWCKKVGYALLEPAYASEPEAAYLIPVNPHAAVPSFSKLVNQTLKCGHAMRIGRQSIPYHPDLRQKERLFPDHDP